MDNQRGISKELFNKSGLESTPNNWHIWKRAFDLGVSKAKESDLLNPVINHLPKEAFKECKECGKLKMVGVMCINAETQECDLDESFFYKE